MPSQNENPEATPAPTGEPQGQGAEPAPKPVDVARKNRVFCNRNLRMDSIEMIGFDMDYTLALYHQDKLERAVDRADAREAGREHGLPRGRSARSRYDPQLGDPRADGRSPARQRLQDGPARVRRSLLPRLSRARSRDSAGRSTATRRSTCRADRFDWIDTLFASARGGDVRDARRLLRPHGRATVDYDKLFGDIRDAHRRGAPRRHAEDVDQRGPRRRTSSRIRLLGETLHKFRSSGKKLFLLTNSLWDYTTS